MFKQILATLFLTLFSFSLLANATEQEVPNLAGMWVGYYKYGENTFVECSMVLEQKSTIIKGKMIEVQTFGDEPSIGLSADITATFVKSNGVFMVKQYDGSGGQQGKVVYNLTRSHNDSVLTGKWFIKDGPSGYVKFMRYVASN
ncbi:hypothetical protein MHM98_09795 [Psychrobium sp. MM17-31]|uniref:hypothetical protein n=1 Tax=Psychrobium sp. MM17-31 TaxID=2917758 RepID=UPI001EF741DF|nr:hypothetical protein [Psychrobium sp. MM17-31]MCG7531632.1 hypothetical protein [Psychrobium sp. MM17-31]